MSVNHSGRTITAGDIFRSRSAVRCEGKRLGRREIYGVEKRIQLVEDDEVSVWILTVNLDVFRTHCWADVQLYRTVFFIGYEL